MRPGQETPDEVVLQLELRLHAGASMRPGQETPDEAGGRSSDDHQHHRASMRPGQETPDEVVWTTGGFIPWEGFNEAGARNPG